MTHDLDPQGPDAPIPLTTRRRLQAQLEEEVHLLHEPLSQADLDRLYALYDHWQDTLGDSPEAIALSDALDDFISACIEAGEGGDPTVEQTYMALLQSVQEGGA